MINFLKQIYRSKIIHWFAFPFAQMCKVFICRVRYRRILSRIRAKVKRGEKLKVIFLVDDPSKWKCQSVYDAMRESKIFDPIVGIGLRKNRNYELTDEDRRNRYRSTISFYERLECKWVWACDIEKKTLIPMDKLNADIVFYQEPWLLYGCHMVMEVAKVALTVYVPYAIKWQLEPAVHWQYDFHRLLFLYFTWNKEHVQEEAPRSVIFRACTICETGHPTLDWHFKARRVLLKDKVIYAPHFSFQANGIKNIFNFGTFEWNGREMLEYAQQHPEIKWVWKPHSSLRWRLEMSGYMTRDEVDSYYAAWESIGEACYDGDYSELFMSSRAIITDCGSFQFEYAPTGMPIIRPVSKQSNLRPGKVARELFSTYYTVHNWEEMKEILDQVVVRQDDFRREERQDAVKKANLVGNHAGQNVVDVLSHIVGA